MFGVVHSTQEFTFNEEMDNHFVPDPFFIFMALARWFG
jgi:hypothetical protein